MGHRDGNNLIIMQEYYRRIISMNYNTKYILVIQYNIYLLKPGKSLNIIIGLMYCQNNGQNYRTIINSATQCTQNSWYKENPVSPGTHWQ